MRFWGRVFMFLCIGATWLTGAWQSGAQLPYELSADKSLTLPDVTEYRTWPFMGTSLVPDDKNNNKAIFPGIHTVYINPSALETRREKGVFPDGTIILMENFHVEVKEAESGYGYFTTGGMDLLAAIKDRRQFSGSGWGYYAFFDRDLKAGKKVVPLQAPAKCQSCHTVGAADDEVFTQYYPSLKRNP
ncbi:Cytochrome P460 family protein [Sulfidibacter corallicola]|uniref:Cytochrome P460 family protein n=1 Tax=Sulfidibacter corallicola TaxID=2818388 RepID=A0A8A4TDK5_SULCO|nr:cytochrome P460 family protein [Sulfidibacter corallicola]QTD48006.1 cytochrome P460 family protein [Sulfidibacter corallicola]